MNIVFDMDNTLTDEFGSNARPGIERLLHKLKAEGHVLIIWTSSTRERAIDILRGTRLYPYFSIFFYREDYDPENRGIHKDIRKVNGDMLIDDDPDEIAYMKKINRRGILITPYRKGRPVDSNELDEIYKIINIKKKRI